MILVRPRPDAPAEEIELGEFERRAREGEIAPQHEVCFPAVTGSAFVKAGELELYRGLYAAGTVTFRRYFHLARFPWMTIGLIALLAATYFGWQGGRVDNIDDLLRLGAKSRTLIIELGQWWRLITANLLHVSGWHLLVNTIFLLNLGGPTEAAFRRLDYSLILVAAAIGTTLVSATINPAVSCGASGVVFGVWGAAAVFGVRHRDILPDRYRRYFIGSVIPYSIFALYLGFAIDGVDNWGHLGGLTAGSVTAYFLPARLLAPRDRAVPTKVLALTVVVLVLAAGTLLPAGVGTLSMERFYSRHGLRVPIPERWDTTLTRREGDRETFAFENPAGVSVGLAARRLQRPMDLGSFARSFVETELAAALEEADVRGVRISDPIAAQIAGTPARRIRADLLTANGPVRSDFVLFGRGNYQYVLRFSAPRWLAPTYQLHFTAIESGTELKESEELRIARLGVETAEDAQRLGDLALATAHIGDQEAATAILRAAKAEWPNSAELATVEAQLLWEHRERLEEACDLMRGAIGKVAWSAPLVAVAVSLFRSCGERRGAEEILGDGLQRFPENPALQRLRQTDSP